MKVAFSNQAEIELEAIGDYIGRFNYAAAMKHVKMLREKCLQLAEFPLIYPLVEGLDATGVRKRTLRNYLIFYTVDDDQVYILHIIHGARDIATIFGSE